MGFVGILILAFGLAMDSSAISACKGLAMPKMNYRHTVIIALSFGGAEAGLAFLGWLLGRGFFNIISAFDHWVVLILLSIIGGKMIWDAFHEDPEEMGGDGSFDARETIVLSIVTSVDAMAAGVSFAFMKINVPVAVVTIGIVSSSLSFLSVLLGHYVSAKFGQKAEVAGGVVLILIGIYIFASDLGLIPGIL